MEEQARAPQLAAGRNTGAAPAVQLRILADKASPARRRGPKRGHAERSLAEPRPRRYSALARQRFGIVRPGGERVRFFLKRRLTGGDEERDGEGCRFFFSLFSIQLMENVGRGLVSGLENRRAS